MATLSWRILAASASSSSEPNKSTSSSSSLAAGLAAAGADVPLAAGQAFRSPALNELIWLKNLTA